MKIPGLASFAIAAAFVLTSLSVAAEDWPQWGGPQRNFQVAAPALTEGWGKEGPPRLWSRPLGQGLSAVIVVDGSLYTMYGENEDEIVVAVDAETGVTSWEHRYHTPLHHEHAASFHQGPSSTPLVAQGNVIAIGYTGQLHALDTDTGVSRWSYDLIRDFGGRRLRFGHAASPLLYEDRVIVLVGGQNVGVLAFDPRNGSVLWRSLPFYVSYASPIAARVDGQDQIIFLSAEEILALDAENGELLWRVPCRNGFANNASDPVWGAGNLLWVASQPGDGARALHLTRYGDDTQVERLWADSEISLHYWNGIRVDETIYASIGPSGADFAAIDIKTGEVAWREADRFEKARPVYADDKMIALDETGQLVLARLSPHKIEILGQHQLFDSEARTVPTLAGTSLYVRDSTTLIALDLSP